jgi:hypothetical protein
MWYHNVPFPGAVKYTKGDALKESFYQNQKTAEKIIPSKKGGSYNLPFFFATLQRNGLVASSYQTIITSMNHSL